MDADTKFFYRSQIITHVSNPGYQTLLLVDDGGQKKSWLP